MSNKRKQIKMDDQATSRMYTEEYQALKKENVQLKQAVEDDCVSTDRERDRTAELKDVDVDVTISIAGKDFAVNRNILSASSPIFADLLEANCKENRLVIDHMAVDVFETLLSIIYTGKVPALKPKMAEDLLVVADKYKLEQLKSITEDYLCGQLSGESVVSLHTLAEATNAPKLKDKCLKLLCRYVSTSRTAQPFPPVTCVNDPCLIALFKQLPPADQITARKVCSRWADLVTYAARSTRTLAILIGDQTMDQFANSVNYNSLGRIRVVKLLKKEDGSPMVTQSRFTQWNSLHYPEGGLSKVTVQAIGATFVNLNTLQIAVDKASSSQLDFISNLLKLWRPQLSTLKVLESSYRGRNESTATLFAAINALSRLKNLHLDLRSLPYHDLPIISKLEHLYIYWDGCSPRQFAALLRQRATANTSLRSVEYLCDDHHSDIEPFTSLDDHLLDRFTRFNLSWNSELISTHFRHLTSLQIRPATTFRRLFNHLSQLTQLLHLYLEINFSLLLPDDQPHLLLSQLKSVKALELCLIILSHFNLEQLKIGWTMPNLEAIDLCYFWQSKCTDCTIEGFSPEHVKANLATFKHCYRQMLAPVKAKCTKLRTILYGYERFLGSAEELLTE